ncbi:MAG TPA: hypothetical protein VFH97_08435 [Gemmatimonadales bacterium]|nr:hypothetical protein [Gemmatimonadales bacterium]
MFIELAEYLRCPHPHEETFLVLSTGAMRSRHVLFGTLGCPVCHAEFPVLDGVARFGEPGPVPGPAAGAPPADAAAVGALLGLESPGGYAVLVGSAGGLAGALGDVLDRVHLICVNPPAVPPLALMRSVLQAPDFIPLRSGVVRGVVLGAESAKNPWLEEAARVLLHGQRLVALTETVAAPPALRTMAVGKGMWVGRKSQGG